MPLKHFCRPRPYFLSDFQNSFSYCQILDRYTLYQKNSLLASSGAEILEGGGIRPPPHAIHNSQGVGMERVNSCQFSSMLVNDCRSCYCYLSLQKTKLAQKIKLCSNNQQHIWVVFQLQIFIQNRVVQQLEIGFFLNLCGNRRYSIKLYMNIIC